ncbi:MAG: hypothetical protein HYZ26_14315 [Chloroflexi bacterium]|nr:hypothetical protein [Chloroflexota bacterium]
MKKFTLSLLTLSIIALAALAAGAPAPALAAGRPVVVLAEYVIKPGTVHPGQEFDLYLRFKNQGTEQATDLVVTLGSGDVFPRRAGGVYSLGVLNVNTSKEIEQVMIASDALPGDAPVSMPVTITYSDAAANSYSESFTVVVTMAPSPTATAVYYGPPVPTATPTPQARPQLVIVGYRTDPVELAPGTRFELSLEVKNVGSANAADVLMVAGGATVQTGTGDEGTGQPTVSGGDFSKFSPLGVSNVQAIGSVPAGGTISAAQPLIVNVTTEPGAYSFPISFVYLDKNNETRVDNQVITLLVYSPPNVEISFYQPAGPFFAGQANFLPLQIVNLGRKTIILGSMTVSADGAYFENNTLLVGPLDPGGYNTLDAAFTPDFEGLLTLNITVEYTDDFNDPQTLTRTLEVQVESSPAYGYPPEGYGYPPYGEYQPPPTEETFLQKVWRFFLGLLGLDSSADTGSEVTTPYGDGYTTPYTPPGGGGGGGGGKSP